MEQRNLQPNRENIKQRLTDSKEYFLFFSEGNMEGDINILKAFSLFKNWQKTNMMLLIMNVSGEKNNNLKEKLTTYKFRKDVIFFEDVSLKDYHQIISAAYAALIFFHAESFLPVILNCVQNSAPAIILSNFASDEIYEDAALYVENMEPQTVYEKMLSIYKDEHLRSRLVENAQRQSLKINYSESFERLSGILGLK